MAHEETAMAVTLPRITARIDEDMQALLNRAAALVGMKSINAFVVSAALEKARQIIAEEERLQLSEREARQLMEALDTGPKRHEKLAEAFKKHSG
jgi:uncharacterized protein (DUF1778 family)